MTNDDLRLTVLSTDVLEPNGWNPNEMDAEQFAELVAEVRHLGRICKPIIVRPEGDRFVIVDGEHNWRAAREAGFNEVPCEVLETDEFEAMRQTWKRNLGGSANQILAGQMFKRMLDTKNLSQRKLAKEIGISDGTIRNALTYLTVYELHLGYLREIEPEEAGRPQSTTGQPSLEETANRRVSALAVRQVKFYPLVPEQIRDIWLIAGAPMTLLEGHVWPEYITPQLSDLLACDLVNALSGYKGDFDESLERALRFLRAREQFGGFVGWDKFFTVAANCGFGPKVLSVLPLEKRDDEWHPVATLGEWRTALQSTGVLELATKAEKIDWVDSEMLVIVRGKQLDREQLRSPDQLLDRRLVDSPEFVRNSQHLTIKEKMALAKTCQGTACSADDIEAARRVCENIERLRKADGVEDVDIPRRCQQERKLVRLEQRLGGSGREQTVHKIATRLAKRLGDRALTAEDVHDGRLVIDVLTERLAALPAPEFGLVMCLVDDYDEMSLMRFWLNLITRKQEQESPLRQSA